MSSYPNRKSVVSLLVPMLYIGGSFIILPPASHDFNECERYPSSIYGTIVMLVAGITHVGNILQ